MACNCGGASLRKDPVQTAKNAAIAAFRKKLTPGKCSKCGGPLMAMDNVLHCRRCNFSTNR